MLAVIIMSHQLHLGVAGLEPSWPITWSLWRVEVSVRLKYTAGFIGEVSDKPGHFVPSKDLVAIPTAATSRSAPPRLGSALAWGGDAGHALQLRERLSRVARDSGSQEGIDFGGIIFGVNTVSESKIRQLCDDVVS